MARQAALPVGREQPQRLPALAPPGVRYFSTLEQDVVDRALGEKPARREAGMSGPDDDRRELLYVLTTSTVTLTGFVRASYTAERFCDCATIASMSSFDASASISKVTLMSS